MDSARPGPPYEVRIVHLTGRVTMLDVRCMDRERSLVGDTALALGREESLLIEPDRDRIDAIRRTWPDSIVATDVSAMYARYRVTGLDAIAVLAQGCPLDLERMASGTGTRSVLARTAVVVIREDAGFLLLVERSYVRYAENWLAAASGREIERST